MKTVEERISDLLDSNLDVDYPAEALTLAMHLLCEAMIEIKSLKGGDCCGKYYPNE